ncbi:glycosyltransferase family 4 protein [Parashewanella tropica]|uniref:glycosyltransferase family 4 protein n=1 Tax=Parashewanella tropica TaxID=2547970 RepID=UPI0010595BE6|nr:glycosyltransferase family 4 protein [Parashewanella tropica]
MKILIISTPVQAIGQGEGGGIDITLLNIINALSPLGHQFTVLAPTGSKLSADATLIEISGRLQTSVQTESASTPATMSHDSTIVSMCRYAQTHQDQFDVILNMAYDWLPIWLTTFFTTPIHHLVSMSNENQTVADAIEELNRMMPQRIAFHSHASANTFQLENPVTIIANGFEFTNFPFCKSPKQQLAWVGRISPEKGLENALEVANKVNLPLHIWGKVQSESYQQQLVEKFPEVDIHWRGFVPQQQLLKEMSQSALMLMTPSWIEAFGNNVVEANACGVPVIAYNKGGPTETVISGVTGYLVENNEDMANRVADALKLSRYHCRDSAQQRFSIEQYALKLQSWLSLNID